MKRNLMVLNADTKSETESKYVFRKMYIAALAALLFATSMGMACGYSASATADMDRPSSSVRPKESQVAWIGSILALGALSGGIITGYLSNKLGRKGSLIFSTIPFITGWLFITCANHLAYIYSGRFITGFSVGIICVTTPAYLVEISTPDKRGMLGTSFQLFVVTGVLLVNGLGAVLTWKWLTIPSLVIITMALCGICFVPESPRWLIGRGGYNEAVRAMKFLQGDYLDASAECVAIDEDLRLQPKGSISFKELRKPEALIPAILSFSLVFFQQATGSNAILFYTVDIFKAGQSSLNPNIATIVIDAVQVVATAVSSVLVDKAGRKSLLLASGIGMALSLAVLAAHDYVSGTDENFKANYGWMPVASLVVYIAAFSIGFGPIPWLMMAEMTPVRTRSVICGAATALCWLFVFIVTKTFETLETSIHTYGAYIIYAAFSVLSCLFTCFFLPETKGKQIEDIQQYFMSYHVKAVTSKNEGEQS